MAAWTADELRRIAGADELQIAPVRRNGELRRETPIWVVRVGDDPYVRSAYRADSGWHGVASTSHSSVVQRGRGLKIGFSAAPTSRANGREGRLRPAGYRPAARPQRRP